jgi:hypothetical protein
MGNRGAIGLLTVCFLLTGEAGTSAQVACKPLLSVKPVQDTRTSLLLASPSRWSATIAADTSFCATRFGRFEIDFVRIKEDAPDLQFTQVFHWSQDTVDVSMDLTPGEAILEYRIGFIAPCVCRGIDQLSSSYPRDVSQAR